MSFAQTRVFQKRAGIPIDSERKSLIYDHALSMPTLVLPLGDGAIPPMASLVVLLVVSLSLLVCSVTLVYQSFDCWASPGKVSLLLCHF